MWRWYYEKTIVTIYIPPEKKLTRTRWDEFLASLPQPCVIVGDCNAHNEEWGSYKTDIRGRIIQSSLTNCGLQLINTKEPTLVNFPHSNTSILDLMIVSGDLAGLCTFTRHNKIKQSLKTNYNHVMSGI